MPRTRCRICALPDCDHPADAEQIARIDAGLAELERLLNERDDRDRWMACRRWGRQFLRRLRQAYQPL